MEPPKSFADWATSVPSQIRSSPLWEYQAYQKSLFLYELVWFDCEVMMKDMRGRAIAEQIIRSSGSISANIEEGYSRGFGRDYARFLSIALGSARETQGWYVRARHLLAPAVLEHRLALLDEIISLLITTIQRQRQIVSKKR